MFHSELIDLLKQILGELRKFNQTIPLLDDLAEKQDAIRDVEDLDRVKKSSASRVWEKYRGEEIHPPKSSGRAAASRPSRNRNGR